MAIDGTSSPEHQLSAEADTVKTVKTESLSDKSRDSCSPDAAVAPSDGANLDVKPAVSSMSSDEGLLSVVKSSSSAPDGSNYYFGESHVTRLESFVESLTGPLNATVHSVHSSNTWSSPRDRSHSTAGAAINGSVPARKVHSQLPGEISSSSNQPLDLSVKARGHSKHKFNDSPTSASYGFSESSLKTTDGMSSFNAAAVSAAAAAAAAAGVGFPTAGYPTLADMWVAHWLSMATAASNLLTGLPLPLTNHHLLTAASPPLREKTNGLLCHSSSERLKMSPLLQSVIESPKSSSLSCPTPTKSGSNHDGALNQRRQRRDAAHQPSSAFSLFRRNNPETVSDLRTEVSSESATGGDDGRRTNVVAALSAIESFVENSFSHYKNGRTSNVLSRDLRHYGNLTSSPTGLKRGRHIVDDHMTSSGDDETGSCDDAERTTESRHGIKRRRQYLQKSEVVQQRHDNDVDRKRESTESSRVAQSVQSDVKSSSLEYLQCLAYDRPIDSEHPLECLERLVHVQSSSRRSAVPAHNIRSPVSPSMTSRRRRNDDVTTSPSGRASDAGSESDNQVTCSSSLDGVDTTSKDDVASVQMVGAFRNQSASLVCCNI